MKKFIILFILLVVATKTTERLPDIKLTPIPMSEPTQVEKFMKRIAIIESDNNHRVVNEFGMMGKYQFSPSTVRVLGFKISKKEFLDNPHLQDTVMLAYMKANQQDLRPLIKKYNGKVINGVKITRAGILAGAHFAGSGNVVAFFNSSGEGISDARGTTVKKYMSYFSNFNLSEI
jgi:hypothetical protein